MWYLGHLSHHTAVVHTDVQELRARQARAVARATPFPHPYGLLVRGTSRRRRLALRASERAIAVAAVAPSLDGPGVADVRRLRRNLMSSASRPSDGSSTSAWSAPAGALADGVFIERFDDS